MNYSLYVTSLFVIQSTDTPRDPIFCSATTDEAGPTDKARFLTFGLFFGQILF